MNPYTIPPPDPGGNTIFTDEDWVEHGSPPILILAEGWTAIGEETFYNEISLVSIRIPASLVDIRENAFRGAKKLREIEFVEGSLLEFIRTGAFAGAIALKRINIPASVTHIGIHAFNGVKGLEEIIFAQGSQIEMFGFQMFYGATSLASIRIPASVRAIGPAAFRSTSSLVEVVFEEGSQLNFIGAEAFKDATALQRIRIPSGVNEIDMDTFTNTPSLREVTFEQNSQITRIEHNAFRGSGLTLVAIGETALNRLNDELNALNVQPLRFGNNNNFYGKPDVKIVSRTQQINTLAMIARNPVYTNPGFFGRLLGKSPTKTRSAVPQHLVNMVGELITGIKPKSNAALAARAAAATAAATAGGRKSRRRKRGVRRKSRKTSTTRRMQKRRRTMKRK